MSMYLWGSTISFVLALFSRLLIGLFKNKEKNWRMCENARQAEKSEKKNKILATVLLVALVIGSMLIVFEAGRVFLEIFSVKALTRGLLVSVIIKACLVVLAWCTVMVIIPKDTIDADNE